MTFTGTPANCHWMKPTCFRVRKSRRSPRTWCWWSCIPMDPMLCRRKMPNSRTPSSPVSPRRSMRSWMRHAKRARDSRIYAQHQGILAFLKSHPPKAQASIGSLLFALSGMRRLRRCASRFRAGAVESPARPRRPGQGHSASRTAADLHGADRGQTASRRIARIESRR